MFMPLETSVTTFTLPVTLVPSVYGFTFRTRVNLAVESTLNVGDLSEPLVVPVPKRNLSGDWNKDFPEKPLLLR